MTRSDEQLLDEAHAHLTQALAYAAESPLDQKTIDATCMRIAAPDHL